MSRTLLAARRWQAGLDLTAGGTRTRSTEGSYLTAAPTNGSPGYLDWAAVDAIRSNENRGDGLGAMLRLEGGRENKLSRSEEFSNATWVKTLLTVAADTEKGPDGVTDADTLQFTAALAYISQASSVVPADATRGVFTVYLRAAAAQTVRLRMLQKDGVTMGADVSCAVTSTWQRFELNQAVGSGVAAPKLEIWNHTDLAARDVFAWGAQFECTADTVQFPSSYARTAAAAVTRGADRLSYAVGQYPASFGTAGFACTFAPDYLPAELSASTAFLVNGMDAGSLNDGVLLSYNVLGSPRIFVDDVSKFTGILTWAARGQVMRFEIRPGAGTVTISGATTGNGVHSVGAWVVPCDWPLWVGMRQDATSLYAAFGRFNQTIESL